MIKSARRFFALLLCASVGLHVLLLAMDPFLYVPRAAQLERKSLVSKSTSRNESKNVAGGQLKCVNERLWIEHKLLNAKMSVPRCSYLSQDYAKNETECRAENGAGKEKFSEGNVLYRISNCSAYFSNFSSVAFLPKSDSEEKTPLAFVIVAHGHLGLLEAQLAAIFRPHNAYCIFIDSKAPAAFKANVRNLLQCYQMHFPSSKILLLDDEFPVFWADISLLKADVQCMRQLLTIHTNWKYVINQAGTSLPQIPVKSMAQWLGNLKNGQDAVISGPMPRKLINRIAFVHERPESWNIFERGHVGENVSLALMAENAANAFMYPERPIETAIKKEQPPFELRIFKGEREMVLSRATVEFALNSEIGQALWDWIQNVEFPEEIFFNTLVRLNQKDPFISSPMGQQIANQHLDKKYDYTHGICARRTLWYFNRKHCFGVMKRHLCNLDLKDLPEVYERKCLFINKFDLSVDARIVDCLHQYLTRSTL